VRKRERRECVTQKKTRNNLVFVYNQGSLKVEKREKKDQLNGASLSTG